MWTRLWGRSEIALGRRTSGGSTNRGSCRNRLAWASPCSHRTPCASQSFDGSRLGAFFDEGPFGPPPLRHGSRCRGRLCAVGRVVRLGSVTRRPRRAADRRIAAFRTERPVCLAGSAAGPHSVAGRGEPRQRRSNREDGRRTAWSVGALASL